MTTDPGTPDTGTPDPWIHSWFLRATSVVQVLFPLHVYEEMCMVAMLSEIDPGIPDPECPTTCTGRLFGFAMVASNISRINFGYVETQSVSPVLGPV